MGFFCAKSVRFWRTLEKEENIEKKSLVIKRLKPPLCKGTPVRTLRRAQLRWREAPEVGALRKHAGGMFLASDLGGYAAVASIWVCSAHILSTPQSALRLTAPLTQGSL